MAHRKAGGSSLLTNDDAVNQRMAVGRCWADSKYCPTAILFFCADVQKQATNGSRKATPEGVFDRAQKRPGPGAWVLPTSVSKCPKGYSETLLAYVIGTALPTCSLKPSLPPARE